MDEKQKKKQMIAFILSITIGYILCLVLIFQNGMAPFLSVTLLTLLLMLVVALYSLHYNKWKLSQEKKD